MQKAAIFFFLVLSGLSALAQKKIKGAYMPTWNDYTYTDDNIQVRPFANMSGKIILPVIYDSLETSGKDKIPVKKDNITGLISSTGKVIYERKYQFINCVDGKVVEIY